MSIEVLSISKSYANHRVLKDVSFSIGKGSIVGFLGPNGAGKSTLMKIVTGAVRPTQGSVLVHGIDVLEHPIEAQKKIGYLSEQNPLYTDMYVREYLRFQAAIYKVSKKAVETTIERVGLASQASKKIGELSKGYRQRVGLAAAFIHDPEVFILDEPTTGLDPNQLVEIRELIREKGKEKTILFSTHIMQEVEAVCDRIILLQKGEIVADEEWSKEKAAQKQVLEVAFHVAVEASQLKTLPHLDSCFREGNSWILVFATSEDRREEVFDFAQKNQLKILKLQARSQNVESLFQEYTKDFHSS